MASKNRMNSNAPNDGPAIKKRRTNHQETTTSLVILSWNIAECKPSNDAPTSSSSSFDAEGSICEKILQQKADILCLQECPSISWNPYELLEACYERVGSVPSHCGFVQLWIKKELMYQPMPVFKSKSKQQHHHHHQQQQQQPSVGVMVLVGSKSICITSSHLVPFKDNAAHRMEQVRALVKASIQQKCSGRSIHAGDFNMRQAEDDAMEKMGLEDAWKVTGQSSKHNFTWNSIVNKYHHGGYPFKCRFDRIYLGNKSGGRAGSGRAGSGDIQVTDFSLFANTPVRVNKKEFYLSDHFGIRCTISVTHEE